MRVPLSDQTEARLVRAFGGADLAEARRLLESDCAEGVPGWEGAGLDRIRAAALRLSGGDLGLLLEAIVLAQTDFRDLLVAAGFANDVHAHESWWPDRDPGFPRADGKFDPEEPS